MHACSDRRVTMPLKIFKEHAESFPISDIPSAVAVFRRELDKKEPDLLLLSLVAGAIENTMTCVRPTVEETVAVSVTAETSFDVDQVPLRLPDVELHIIEALYTKFYSIIKSSVDPLQFDEGHASRELVKKVSDVIWNTLTRSYYKDRAHLQSMYSYLTGW